MQTASGLVLPDHVAQNFARGQMVQEVADHIMALQRELKGIDPALSFVQAAENANYPGVVPGFWHVRRRNEGAPDSYIPITDAGAFRYPDSGVLDHLRANDLHKREVFERYTRRQEDAQKAKAREAEERREERKDDLYWRIKAKDAPAVRVTKDT